jgi:hypothetical protein
VRIRTLLTFGSGAAVGAGAMYLLDPAHGEARRREARKLAAAQAKQGAIAAVHEARRRAEEVAVAAAAGFRESRAGDGPSAQR